MSLRVYFTALDHTAGPGLPGGGELPANVPQLAELREQLGAEGMLLVIGPHYLELYLSGAGTRDDIAARARAVFVQVLQKNGLAPETASQPAGEESGAAAVAHFLRSALGWMPDGRSDEQHARALRQAHGRAQEQGLAGVAFNRLFERSLWLSEKVRLETNFFQHATSVASALVEVATKIFGGLKDRTALLVGATNEAASAAAALRDADLRRLFVLGREEQVEAALSRHVPGAVPLQVRNGGLEPAADLILIFEALQPAWGDPRQLQRLMSRRNNAPLLFADLCGAVANVPALQKMSNLYFFARPDLNRLIEQNLHNRREVESEVARWIGQEVEDFQQWLASENRFHFGAMVGSSRQMQSIFELIARIARTDITVLIQGESGTGKELVAAAVHESSGRARRPFIVVNCGAIPENLLESELFGHVRGAFTGAINNKRGLFEEAEGGTIFLDEVGELPAALQVKLLRFLQEGEIKRVGSNTTVKVDVRVIAASNRDLQEMVAQGRFRSDLYYRLNVIAIDLPPLRQRVEDIPVLARHFLRKYAARMRKPARELTAAALQVLSSYHWPGNVRELENVMERAVALATDREIDATELPESIRNLATARPAGSPRPSLKEVERLYIFETLEHCAGNYDEAARVLGIGRTTLWRKLKEYQNQG